MKLLRSYWGNNTRQHNSDSGCYFCEGDPWQVGQVAKATETRLQREHLILHCTHTMLYISQHPLEKTDKQFTCMYLNFISS